MAVGFPTKANWAAGDVLTASAQDDLAGTLNLLSNASAASGSQLISNAAGTSFAYQATPSSSNPVLNSAFQVWQRSTSIAYTASTQSYNADRFYLNVGANQASVVSRQVTNDTTNLPSIQYCARVQRNSGQTGITTMAFSSSFETINSIPFAGKAIAFSFYARAGANYSATSNAFGANLLSGTSTDQNVSGGFTGQAGVASGTATLTTTWQRFTYTGTVASTATQLGLYFTFTPTGTAGTNDYFEVTGVQIDIGSVALPFRSNQPTYALELAACQRYYNRIVSTGAAFAKMGNGLSPNSTTIVQVAIPFPVEMRTVPTSVDFANLGVYDGGLTAVSAVSLDGSCTRTGGVSCTTALVVAYRPYILIANNNTSAYLGFNAEL
jgi:hypothetical protein